MRRNVFLTGATGFLGTQLAGALLQRNHIVRALVRPGSERKVPPGAGYTLGDPFDSATYRHHIEPGCTFIHLIGVHKPAPWKERQFRAIDLASLRQSVIAAAHARAAHFIFISVAHPAPIMKAYIQVRLECEQAIADARLTATILRPWYVLGPGRRWPLILAPFYKLGELLAPESAARLGLVTHQQMTSALVWAVENPGNRILDVPAIRSACP
jgi:uncharacterized protein YbjT (DUF2867 family)